MEKRGQDQGSVLRFSNSVFCVSIMESYRSILGRVFSAKADKNLIGDGMASLSADRIAVLSEDTVIETGYGPGPPPRIIKPSFGSGDNGSNGETGQTIGNAFLAMMLFIGADVMFFAGLIGAFIVFRFGAENWPPPGQPRLPIGVTGVNTAILLCSSITMLWTWRTLRKWNRRKVIRGIVLTVALGTIFLLVQGYEWVRLLRFGLMLSSGVFGATFYTLIGCHALHVIGAAVWLLVVLVRLVFNPIAYGPNRTVGIKLIGMYWLLVVGLWPILYGLVYLS